MENILSAHRLLKEETKSHHHELESNVLSELKHIRSEADYARLLGKFYRFNVAIEPLIRNFIDASVLPDIQDRRKAHSLKVDIKDLGADLPEGKMIELPTIQNVQTALGALYVLEGSTLGGPVIVSILKKKAGIEKGHLFFLSYGEEKIRAKWLTFLDVLDRYCQTEEDKSQALEGAKDTFVKFSKLFR